jgi:hypothetical protein
MKRMFALLFSLGAIVANAQSFSDTFNRPDGAVANGWNTWGAGAQISNGQLATFGSPNVAGGVKRTLAVTLPVRFSFDFRTSSPTDGGWLIGFNAANNTACGLLVTCSVEFALLHYNGGRGLVYVYQTATGPQEASVPIVAGQELYQADALSHIDGVLNADLSSSTTITYPDSSKVTIATPSPAGAIINAQGSQLVLGNTNAIYGPHYFDNFQLTPGPPAIIAVSVAKNYAGLTNLSCPAGYTAIVASCDAGASVVINGQGPAPPAGAWLSWLTPTASAATGVHCNLGNAALQSQAILRCAN